MNENAFAEVLKSFGFVKYGPGCLVRLQPYLDEKGDYTGNYESYIISHYRGQIGDEKWSVCYSFGYLGRLGCKTFDGCKVKGDYLHLLQGDKVVCIIKQRLDYYKERVL